jgi:hypothetical protein
MEPYIRRAMSRTVVSPMWVASSVSTARPSVTATVRGGVTGSDVVLPMTGVHQVAAPLRDAQPELWRRYLGFLLDDILDTTSSSQHSRT